MIASNLDRIGKRTMRRSCGVTRTKNHSRTNIKDPTKFEVAAPLHDARARPWLHQCSVQIYGRGR